MEFNDTQLIEYDKSIRPKMLNDYVGQDDIKEMIRNVSAILADVAMYGTNEMSLKCTQFMEFWNKKLLSSEVCTLEGYKELDRAMSVLLGEMKQELGMK